MIKNMEIQEAIQFIKDNRKDIPFGTVISGFDSSKLMLVQGSYNHNYFDYDGTIILEECDDDGGYGYSVCDSDFKIIGFLGFKDYDEDDEICNLYTWH